MSDKVNFGDELVSPEEKTRRVGAVFSSVARALRRDERPDVGRHAPAVEGPLRAPGEAARRAKRSSTWPAAPATSPSAWPRRGAQVTVADINPDMLGVGVERARASAGSTAWSGAAENAETLSFADRSFDAYTIAFGIRNVTDIPAALREAHRVLQARRALLLPRILDQRLARLRRSSTTPIRASSIPRIGKAIADDEESYRYLVESIRRFPTMPTRSAR